MSKEKVFGEGIFYKERPTAPSFVKGSLSIDAEVFSEFLKRNRKEDGYVNLDIMESKKKPGSYYLQVDTWVPDKKKVSTVNDVVTDTEEEDDDDLPF